MNEPGFHITRGRGFHVTFENGYTVSVQFGPGNYCDNRDARFDDVSDAGTKGSSNAEVAVLGPTGEFIRRRGWEDDVCGWQTPEQVLDLMKWAEALKARVPA